MTQTGLAWACTTTTSTNFIHFATNYWPHFVSAAWSCLALSVFLSSTAELFRTPCFIWASVFFDYPHLQAMATSNYSNPESLATLSAMVERTVSS